MKNIIVLILLLSSTASSQDTVDSNKINLKTIVLPYHGPHKKGPNINTREYIESSLNEFSELGIVSNIIYKFYKLNVKYGSVYDKRYCKDIINKMNPDIIIMSKIGLGKIASGSKDDIFSFEIKLYNTRTDIQKIILGGEELTAEQIKKLIDDKKHYLRDEILNSM